MGIAIPPGFPIAGILSQRTTYAVKESAETITTSAEFLHVGEMFTHANYRYTSRPAMSPPISKKKVHGRSFPDGCAPRSRLRGAENDQLGRTARRIPIRDSRLREAIK